MPSACYLVRRPSERRSVSFRNSARADGLSGSSLRNRIGPGSGTKAEKVTDVRQLLEEKRQGLSQQRPPVASSGKTGWYAAEKGCCNQI